MTDEEAMQAYRVVKALRKWRDHPQYTRDLRVAFSDLIVELSPTDAVQMAKDLAQALKGDD